MLTFSEHALLEMARRGIGELDVRTAWASFHAEERGTHRTRPTIVRIGPAVGGRALCVVVDEYDPTIIVTAYWRET